MATIRREVMNAAYDKAYALIQNDNMHIRFRDIKEFVLKDETLTEEEKIEVIKRFDGDYDYFKVVENDDRVKRTSKGGCSDIYTADWEEGGYKEWDIKERKLKRAGKCKVVLKKLENVEDADRTWLEEATTHLFIIKKLMEECWDANPEKRPDIHTLWERVENINKSIHENSDHWETLHIDKKSFSGNEMVFSNSKLYTFHDVPQPKNATEEEQDAYYTSQFNLHISDFPDDI
ncbi:uncharacterized protein OCT59_002120 [Rhizophagus irregularis]|uniref:uncharacterized protein n=1 Tax=Rhizophagus irregularis TaxID=588596 RepID=UPI0033254663|nr:hypothetical protein OCT59_002120 [Rhizophagus irregularis]